MYFDKYLTEVCSQECNKQYSRVDSDNGLVPARRPDIIWIYAG